MLKQHKVSTNIAEKEEEDNQDTCPELTMVEENRLAGADNSSFSDIDLNEFGELCDEQTLSVISSALENGVLKPKDMAPISLLEDGLTGLYAKRVCYSNGKTQVVLVYFRRDGSFTEEIPVPTPELFKIMSSYRDSSSDRDNRSASQAIEKISKKLLEYWDGISIFNTRLVLETLIAKLPFLPIDRTQALDIKTVYAQIVQKADSVKNHPSYSIIFRKGFYAFPSDLFNEVAEDLMMKPNDLVRYLKQNNLLYLQDSSVGFQCKVKGIGYCYCIRTLKKFQHKVVDLTLPKVW